MLNHVYGTLGSLNDVVAAGGRVPVAQGGTGASAFAVGSLLVGNGAGAVTTAAIGAGLTLSGGVLAASGGGGEGVASVGLSMPATFVVSGSPITSSGTFSVTYASQAAGQVFAGPASGAAAPPGFRQLGHSELSGLTTGDPHGQYLFLAGRSGGQTIAGGVSAGEGLTLQSTSSGSKGKIFLGANSAYDQSTDRLGIGKTNPSYPIDVVASNPRLVVTSATGLDITGFQAQSNAGTTFFAIENSAGSTIFSNTLAYATVFGTNGPNAMQFATNNLCRVLLDAKGNLVLGTGALASTATDGFLHIPACAGPPTGTPTTFAGRVPLTFDSTNNVLYIYNSGAWKKVALS